MTTCYKCGCNIPCGCGSSYQIDVATGKSGGSWSFGTRRGKGGKTVISPRYYTGRTYYKKQTVFVCDECTSKTKQKNIGCFGWLVIVLLIVGIATCSSSNKPDVSVERRPDEQSASEQKVLPSSGEPDVIWRDLNPDEVEAEIEKSKE